MKKRESQKKTPITNVLTTAPDKLNMKVGDINVPMINELNRARSTAISRAYRKPNTTSAVSVSILANPNRSPGIGWGINDSETWSTHARDTSSATLCIFLFSVTALSSQQLLEI